MHTKALEAFSIPTRRKHSQSRWQEAKLTCNLRHCWTRRSNSLSSCTHRTVCKKLETREKDNPNKTKWLQHHHRFCSRLYSCISQQNFKFPQNSKTTYDIPSFYKIQSICSCHEEGKIQPSSLANWNSQSSTSTAQLLAQMLLARVRCNFAKWTSNSQQYFHVNSRAVGWSKTVIQTKT